MEVKCEFPCNVTYNPSLTVKNKSVHNGENYDRPELKQEVGLQTLIELSDITEFISLFFIWLQAVCLSAKLLVMDEALQDRGRTAWPCFVLKSTSPLLQ